MKPSVDKFLQIAVVHLLTRTSQALGPVYEQSNVMLLGAMLTAVQQEFERAAARRLEENEALRRLFAEAASTVRVSAELAGRLANAAAATNTSFLVSELERQNADLRGLLIELHAYVEELEAPEARRIEELIWNELAASTERRRLGIGRF